MFTPTLDQVKALAERENGNLVPIYAEIPAGLETPLSAYLKIVRGPYSFLLESVEGGERQARYTFIGTEPYKILKTGPGTESGSIDPLLSVEKELSSYRTIPVKGLPRFLGGAIGYLAYECVRYFEPRVPAAIADPIAVPEAVLMFTDTVLIFDHMNSVIKVVSHVQTNGDIDTAYESAAERISELISRLKGPNPLPSQPTRPGSGAKSSETSSNFSQAEYENVVRQCKAYIVDGDIIQVVPSRRIAKATSAAPLDIYRSLRSLNPSPYMYFLTLDDFHIIGASPEALVRVEDGIVYNYPLAGTFPRGRTPEEDEALATELRNDQKERAEHIMLVDLGRNDVGRVSEAGTVEVTDLMRVVRYSHVMHLESEVRGRLRADQTIYDALRSCLPAGTLSGAPKIRAMEIIAEMELQRRGPYGGAIGYFGFQGNMDTAIPIRTIVLKDGIAYIQAGGGVVYDSIPEQEYQETVNKAQAPLRAIEQAEAAEQC
jgi:anthranilate synthase component 1